MGLPFFVRLAKSVTLKFHPNTWIIPLWWHKKQVLVSRVYAEAMACSWSTAGLIKKIKLMTCDSSPELKNVSSNNAVVHTENSKIKLDLKCYPTDLQVSIVENCGVKGSAAKRGVGDFVIELFYVDSVEAGSTKKAAPFVLRTKKQLEIFRASESRSLLVRIIQRVTTFKKASVNIVFEKATESTAPGSQGQRPRAAPQVPSLTRAKCQRKKQRKQEAYLAHTKNWKICWTKLVMQD